MKIAATIARILLGLIFGVFGSNPFLHFLKMPPMSGPSGAFIGAMSAAGTFSALNIFASVTGDEVDRDFLLPGGKAASRAIS